MYSFFVVVVGFFCPYYYTVLIAVADSKVRIQEVWLFQLCDREYLSLRDNTHDNFKGGEVELASSSQSLRHAASGTKAKHHCGSHAVEHSGVTWQTGGEGESGVQMYHAKTCPLYFLPTP